MGGRYRRTAPYIIIAIAFAVLAALFAVSTSQAGDPDDVVGGVDLELFECFGRSDDDDDDNNNNNEDNDDLDESVDIDEARRDILEESTGNSGEDLAKLASACDRLANGPGKLVPIEETEIVGYVYEFVPTSPNAEEWYAIPVSGIQVVAEGIGFEIFWVSEKDGFFYFYKTRFGAGPILLNLQLPPNAHPINPNVLIESSGREQTWTVFLGFYRGDTAPPNPEDLRTPDGERLPFGDSTFYENVGLDGRSALPAVGGIKEEKNSTPVIALAAIFAIILPVVGIMRLRKNKRRDQIDDY